MSGLLASVPFRHHSKGPEERETQPEEGGSVPGLRAFLAGSPGTQEAVATAPAVAKMCMAGTLQPPVSTPGEVFTLYMVSAVDNSGALVDGDDAGIGWNASCWQKTS